MNEASILFNRPWHYVSVSYRGQEMGLLVETDDEEEALREAEEIFSWFGVRTAVLYVKRVVIQ